MSEHSLMSVNVGGEVYDTTATTLAKGGKKFESYFRDVKLTQTVIWDKERRPFVDADGALFDHILFFLRRDALPDAISDDLGVLKDLQREAEYFGLESLQQSIRDRLVQLGETENGGIDVGRVLKAVEIYRFPRAGPIQHGGAQPYMYEGPRITADQEVSPEGYRLEAVAMEDNAPVAIISKWG